MDVLIVLIAIAIAVATSRGKSAAKKQGVPAKPRADAFQKAVPYTDGKGEEDSDKPAGMGEFWGEMKGFMRDVMPEQRPKARMDRSGAKVRPERGRKMDGVSVRKRKTGFPAESQNRKRRFKVTPDLDGRDAKDEPLDY